MSKIIIYDPVCTDSRGMCFRVNGAATSNREKSIKIAINHIKKGNGEAIAWVDEIESDTEEYNDDRFKE